MSVLQQVKEIVSKAFNMKHKILNIAGYKIFQHY